MLHRLPRCAHVSHARCLHALINHAPSDTGFVIKGVCSVAVAPRAEASGHSWAAGSSWSNWSRWQTWSVLLGVAAAAAWHSQDATTLADADEAWHTATQAAAEQSIADAFNEAVLDWQRSIAQHAGDHADGTPPGKHSSGTSSHSPSSSSSGQAKGPERPSVSFDGMKVSVNIPLLPGVDLPALLSSVQAGVDQLASNSKRVEQQQQSWLLSTQRVQQWQLRRLVGAGAHPRSNPSPSGPSSMQQLSVQVVVPLQVSSPHEASTSSSSSSSSGSSRSMGDAGLIQVAKGARFTADELEFLGTLVAAANKPGSGQGVSQLESSLSPWGLPSSPDKFLDGFDKLGGALLGNIFAELLQELQHGLDYDPQVQQQQDEQQWDLHSRMDRFFGGLGDRLGEGLKSQLQDESFDEQIQNLQQLLQRELQAMTPPDIISWLHDLTEQQHDADEDETHPHKHRGKPLPPAAAGSSSSSEQQMLTGPQQLQQQQQQQQQQQPLLPWQQPSAQSAMRQLEQLGAAVYLPTAAALQSGSEEGGDPQWGVLAGYEAQKQALEDCLLLPLKHPEVYDRVSSRTRASAKSGGARPRAVLFEGPPGTGKTSTARVLAGRASLPLVYVPLEMLVSKWYGESEQNMAKIFKACEALGGCIIFLDELDSLATSRDQGDMHEASRRLLGVLLREIDGFNHRDTGGSSSDGSGGDSSKRSVVIGATNRRQDLDAALLSRFDLSIHFGLPDAHCRAAILQQYAHQLSEADRQQIAAVTGGFSGRDLRDVCEQTERGWASKIIRGQVEAEQLPGVDDYLAAVQQRREGAGRAAAASAVQGAGSRHAWA